MDWEIIRYCDLCGKDKIEYLFTWKELFWQRKLALCKSCGLKEIREDLND